MSFTELFTTFANNLLPIMLIAAAGYILGKTLTVDSRTIGRMVFYIFSPLLVFNLMVTSQLNLKPARKRRQQPPPPCSTPHQERLNPPRLSPLSLPLTLSKKFKFLPLRKIRGGRLSSQRG